MMALQGSADSRNKALRAAPRVARALLAPNESVVGGWQPKSCSRTSGLLTLEEAIAAGASRFRDAIRIGADVWAGVRSQHPYSGPPEEVFAAMGELAHWARVRRVLDVGADPIAWLGEQGLVCQADPREVRSDFCARHARTFATGKRRAYVPHYIALPEGFEIRFLWDAEEEVIVIGWVGEGRTSVFEE